MEEKDSEITELKNTNEKIRHELNELRNYK